MSSLIDRAQVLAEALPYIQKYTGTTIVVKYGGNAMISEELREAVISDIILLSLVGVHVVVVHGGGPEISDMLKKLNHPSQFVDGLRYTDEVTMDVVQQVLCGKVNKDLTALMNSRGGRAIGLCGMDADLFQAVRLDEKYGLVGSITKVEPAVVEDALGNGYIPVVSTVAHGTDGPTAYNINADTAAAKLAVALGAEKLVLLTDVWAAHRPQGRVHPDPPGAGVGDPRPDEGRGYPGGHDPQNRLRGGGGALRCGQHHHPGRPHSPLYPHRALERRGGRNDDYCVKGPKI